MKTHGLIALLLLLAGCASTPPPEVVIKHDLAPPPAPVILPDPYALLPPDIAAAIRSGDNHRVFKHGVVEIYPYSDTLRYAVNCQPNMAVQIRLRYDEDADENSVV